MKRSELKTIIREIITEELALGDQSSGREYRGTAVDEHSETDMNNPEEKREVEIAKKVKEIAQSQMKRPSWAREISTYVEIVKLMDELINMHGAK